MDQDASIDEIKFKYNQPQNRKYLYAEPIPSHNQICSLPFTLLICVNRGSCFITEVFGQYVAGYQVKLIDDFYEEE